jgi:hypothetical protein
MAQKDSHIPRNHSPCHTDPARCRNQLPLVLFTVPDQDWEITICKAKGRPRAEDCFNISRYKRDNSDKQANRPNLLFQRKQTSYGNNLKIRVETVFPVNTVPRITQSIQISEHPTRLNKLLQTMVLPRCRQFFSFSTPVFAL